VKTSGGVKPEGSRGAATPPLSGKVGGSSASFCFDLRPWEGI
jgi:hypothetical protein